MSKRLVEIPPECLFIKELMHILVFYLHNISGCQAKVPDLDQVVGVEENVDRLEVPVNHVLLHNRSTTV